jgi:Flp pilus assembly protein TadB
MQAVPAPGDWLTVLKQYGLATLLTILLLIYLAFFVVEPQRKAQERFMDSVIKTNEINAETVAKQTEIQKQQADALDRFSRNQEETNRIQKQLLDATQRGVWMDKQGKG